MHTDFNWSLLDRDILCSMMLRLRPKIAEKQLTVAQFHKIVSAHIKAHLPVNITKTFSAEQKPGIVYMGGMYYADNDEKGKKHIAIVLSYHPEDTIIRLTRHRWALMCKLFADTMLHEIIHMRQYRSRNFKTIPGYESNAAYASTRKDQRYYGHADEIGAYSFNIACDLVSRLGNNPFAIAQYLNNFPKRHKKSSYGKYLEAFEWDHNHKVIRTLKKRIMSNIPLAVSGKPFTANKYLTY